MRKSLLKTTFLTIIFSLTATSAFAEPAGTVGFQFLRTHVGARASALAGAFVAIDNDINSLHYNPAGIGTVRKKSGSFTYLNDLLDFNTGYIGFVNPNVGPGNVGIGILYKDYGTFDGRDITGEETSEFGANAVSMAASYAVELKQNLFVGASGKFIHYSIENYTSNAVALDAGVLYTIPSQSLNFGFAVYNVGQVTSAFVTEKDDLPFGMRFGATKKLAHLPLMVNVNVYKYNSEDINGAVGGEFTLTESFFLRLGYDTFGQNMDFGTSKDKFAGGSIGFGLIWKQFFIDYSFSSLGEIGSLNRFSIYSSF